MKDRRKKKIKELEDLIEVLLLAIPREIASQQFYQAAVDKATSETTRIRSTRVPRAAVSRHPGGRCSAARAGRMSRSTSR